MTTHDGLTVTTADYLIALVRKADGAGRESTWDEASDSEEYDPWHNPK